MIANPVHPRAIAADGAACEAAVRAASQPSGPVG